MSALTKLEAKALLREAREDTLVVGAQDGSIDLNAPVSGKVGQEWSENNLR